MWLAIILGLALAIGIAIAWSKRKSQETEANKYPISRDIEGVTSRQEPSVMTLEEPAPAGEIVENKVVEPMGEVVAEEETTLGPETTEPKIIVPPVAKARLPFQVYTENLEVGTPIMADKIYPVGQVNAAGVTNVSLGVAGERTIDVKVGETWLSSRVTIQEASAEDID